MKYLIPRSQVPTCSAKTRLVEVLHLLLGTPLQIEGVSVHCVAMVKGRSLLGFITLQNILKCIAESHRWRDVLAQDVAMEIPFFFSLDVASTVHKALDQMHSQQLLLMPVVNSTGKWQGLFARQGLQMHFWREDNPLLELRCARELAATDVGYLEPSTPLLYAAQILGDSNKPYLMVAATGQSEQVFKTTFTPLGFLTETVVLAAALSGANWSVKMVGDCVGANLVEVLETETLVSIASKFDSQGKALVRTGDGHWQGVITKADILDCLDPIAGYWQGAQSRGQVFRGAIADSTLQQPRDTQIIPVERSPYQVLLLENISNDSAILMHLLQPPATSDMAFQVIQVNDLDTALSQLNADRYDLLLVDLNLSETKGLETFRALELFCDRLPIVLLSQNEMEEQAVIRQCLERGAQDYLIKALCEGQSPTERELLMRSIRYAIENHGVQHKLERQMIQTELLQRFDNTDSQVKRIFEEIADIVLLIDPDTWQIQSITTSSSAIESQQIQASIAFLHHNKNQCQAIVRQAIATHRTLRHEYQITDQTNKTPPKFWFTAKITPTDNAQVLWVAHDITPIKQAQQELFRYQQELEAKVKNRTKQLETMNVTLQAEAHQRQQIETALRQEQDFLSTIFNLAGALLVILDRQGQIIRFNPACETLTGFTAAEVIGQQVGDFLLRGEDIPAMERELDRLIREKTSSKQELDWRSKKGQLHRISWKNTVLLDERGEVRYIIATGMDISDRQTLEMTLKTLNQELESRVEQRTQSLDTIQQNLRRQLAAVDAAVEAIAILQQGKFVSVNTAFLKLFGYPHLISLSDHSWDILFAPEEHPRISNEILPQLDTKSSWQGKAIARRPDGSTFTYEMSLTLTPDQDLICVCRDITAREADATKLRATETLLRSQYDNFPIPTYTWQHRNDNFYLINYNAAADIANDHQLNTFVGRTSREVYGRDHAIHRNIMHCFRTQSTFEEELPTQYQSQKTQRLLLRYLIVTYVYIEPDMVMIHTQDLTERKRAEAELEENQAFLKQVIDNDPNLIFVKDEEGRFLLANAAMATLYGTTVDELVGKTDADFNGTTNELQWLDPADRRVLISQKPLLIPEEKIVDFRGEVHYFRTMKIPLKINNEKTCSKLLSVASEITQIRQAQLQLEQSLAQERELNLLKTNFIDTASHEFRTPLTVILGATDILANYQEQLSADRRDRHLHNIQTNAQRIQHLIDDMLSMSRLKSGKLRCDRRLVDVAIFCENLLEEMRLGVGRNHQFAWEMPEAIANPLALDPNLVHHILSNLLSNACKYSPTNSLVILRATYDENAIHFAIIDQGIGIPSTDQPHLFESFYRASNVHTVPGTGLGLNIVQKYVQIHGGTINFVSKLDGGSTFTVSLPIPTEPD